MKLGGRKVLICSCEGTMPLDPAVLARGLGQDAVPAVHRQLCRSQLDSFRAALAEPGGVLVACGQEAPLFRELAREVGAVEPLCVDLRDRAGWSDQAKAAAPKMAALLAESVEAVEPTPSVSLVSEGRILVLGRGQAALDAAFRLGESLSVTFLALPGADPDLIPGPVRALGLFSGQILSASGHLGAFGIKVARLAGASPSARGSLAFEAPVGERTLSADLVLDMSGGPALMSPRDGWLVADPRDPVQVERTLAQAAGLVGSFEKPRWIKLDAEACAHSRNGREACLRCLDLCPSGALLPKGDAVAVQAEVCDGHGACASACPTGAIRFDVPGGNGLYRRLSTLLETYGAAGGNKPVLLVHEPGHGNGLVDALARFGAGLPASVLPLAVPAVAALGPDFILTALAKGVARVIVLADPARKTDLGPVGEAVDLAIRITSALGWDCEARLEAVSDPAQLAALLTLETGAGVTPAAEFLVLGGKRQTLAMALAHLGRHAPTPQTVLALRAGDPFGTIQVDQARCTLCLACIGACPAKALGGLPDKPSLGIIEANCVQCGLCRATCPEKAVTLEPRLSFAPEARLRQVLKEEEPYACLRCGKPFAAASVVERMVERMQGHAMFKGTGRLDLIRMCEDCRVVAQYELEEKTRPMAGAAPPRPRTAEDYRDGE